MDHKLTRNVIEKTLVNPMKLNNSSIFRYYKKHTKNKYNERKLLEHYNGENVLQIQKGYI